MNFISMNAFIFKILLTHSYTRELFNNKRNPSLYKKDVTFKVVIWNVLVYIFNNPLK